MDSSAGCRCREAPWNRFLLALNGAGGVCAAACRRQATYAAAEKPRLQQTGQFTSSYAAAGHTVRGRVARLTGNSQAAQRPAIAMARDCSRSIRLHVRQIRDLTLFGFGLSMKSGPDPRSRRTGFRFCYAIVPRCITHTPALPPYFRKQRRLSAARQRAGKVAWLGKKTP